MESTPSPARNPWYLTAAAAMAVTTLVHVFMGGPEVYAPLRAATLDPVVQSVLSVVWHMVTLVLAIMAITYWVLWQRPAVALAASNGAICLGIALLFLGYGMADLGTLWPMPQWIIFLLVFGLTCLGLRRA